LYITNKFKFRIQAIENLKENQYYCCSNGEFLFHDRAEFIDFYDEDDDDLPTTYDL